MDDKKFKPCYVCGHEAYITTEQIVDDYYGNITWAFAKCTNCVHEVRLCRLNKEDAINDSIIFWNDGLLNCEL